MTKLPKGYELNFVEHRDYLRAQVVAETIDRASAMEYLTAVAGECKRLDATRLMLVRQIPVMLPDADLFFTTTDFLKMIGDLRVAFVNPYSDIHEEMDFAILIGVNRGANYQLFSSESAAGAWLLSK